MRTMKKAILLSLIIISGLFAKAQSSKANLSFQSGVSIPLSDFASTTLGSGSFTTTGFHVSTGFKFKLINHFGATVQSGLNLAPVDVWRLGYAKVQADPFLEDMYIRSDPYRIIHLLAGPNYSKEIFTNLFIQPGISAGVFFSSTPYQLHVPKYFMLGPPFFEITESRDVSFAYGATLSLVYEISPCIGVEISSSILHSTAHFNFRQGNTIRTDTRNITLFNNSLGLFVKLF